MYRLVIVIRAPNRVRLSRLYILAREVIDHFALDDDVACELLDPTQQRTV